MYDNKLAGTLISMPYQGKVRHILILLFARGEEVLRLAPWGGERRDRLDSEACGPTGDSLHPVQLTVLGLRQGANC